MNSLGVDVILEDVRDHPRCSHGPTLLFQRFTCGKKSGKPFYACSAYRDRKDCNFFQWASDVKLKQKSELPHILQLFPRPQVANLLKRKHRNFCRHCSMFLDLSNLANHSSHELFEKMSDDIITQPTTVLQPLTNSKKEAQYFFTDRTVKFIISTIKSLNFNRILSVGCPKIHEYISLNEPSLSSLLLDIDHRFEMFFDDSKFCWYNVFNHHFFRGSAGKTVYKEFLHCSKEDKIIVIMDPPFGGLVDALAYTFKIVNRNWRKLNDKTAEDNLPLLWIFPYFMEKRILNNLPLTMLDYKVDYENHALFRADSRMKHGSPIRVFTNLEASFIPLPLEEGYRYCELCQRHVADTNVHCVLCNKCTSKNGKTYHHCNKCERCVKPSYTHCNTCNMCIPSHHKCRQQAKLIGCHICGDLSHKRLDCPSREKRKMSTKYHGKRRKKVKPC